jgi:hypothetical protein
MRLSTLSGMTARIGAHGLELFGGPRPELLAEVAQVRPKPGDCWVNIERAGFRSTQRLWISDVVGGGVAVATWPAETKPQACHLYRRGFGPALVAAAIDRRWEVELSPHIAFYNSPPGSRLYMSPSIEWRDYVALWEEKDALRRVRYSREDVERQLWPWLKQRGLADDGDDDELRCFLDEFLRMPKADMRPGLRFRRVWTSAEVAGLGSALAGTIREEFDAVFAIAGEPALSSLREAGREAPEGGTAERADQRTERPVLGAPYRRAQVTAPAGNPEPFSVDPALVERGLRGHADTQNELAKVLRGAGIEPRFCLASEPNFDLAWRRNRTVFVAEVKSINDDNEEEQLRLGLGQVLRYRQRLSALGHERVVAVLVPERQPRDPS